MSSLKEECGVVGVFGDPEAANLIYLSLYALQHRGQEACGIITLDEGRMFAHKAFGLVGDAFNREVLQKLVGDRGVGHNRYSTHGGRSMQNIQPFYFKTPYGHFALAHNGNLTNANDLRKKLEAEGSIFQSSSDTEIFMHLVAKSRADSILGRIKEATKQVRGAYSLVILTEDRLFALRDPFGFRPLVLGRKGGAAIVASETCALDLIDAKFEREVAPGEIIEISAEKIQSHINGQRPEQRHAFCSFEPIYFARPDSVIFSEPLYEVRKNLGRELAAESGVEADVVIAVPDSGVPMAIGYSQKSGIPHEVGLVRNHYIGRTFIEPTQSIRDFGVRLKLNPVESVLRGRRVIVVDDSLVRGTTSVKILRMIRSAGAKEIHVRIGSPPITHSCYYGVDTPSRDKLLAAQKNVKDICEFIGADSLAYLSVDGLQRALNDQAKTKYCYACFSGNYPEEICSEILPQPTDAKGPGLRAKC